MILWFGTGLIFAGCQTARPSQSTDPKLLIQKACELGASVRSAKGSVSMSVSSNEGAGRFPALVSATYPDQLQMEVQNLFGGSEAFIRVNGRTYDVRDAHKNETREAGEGNWRGIPLEWAPLLFVGRVPCPSPDTLKGARLSFGGEGDLTVATTGGAARDPEIFVYQFKVWNGQPWPERLHWEKRSSSQPLAVDFKFDDPENESGSPKRWEAKSSRGEVKVRWRDREVSR